MISKSLLQERSQTHYDLLGISPNSKSDEIASAYKQTKDAYSEDSPAMYSVMSEDEASLMLEKINEAYNVLSNPEKRASYDQQLLGKTDNNPSPTPSFQNVVPNHYHYLFQNHQILCY